MAQRESDSTSTQAAATLAKEIFQDIVSHLGVLRRNYYMVTPNPGLYAAHPELPGRLFVFISRIESPACDIRVYLRRGFRNGKQCWNAEKASFGASPFSGIPDFVRLRNDSTIPLFKK